jgi:hypothetical protein
VPLCVSRRRLAGRKTFPRARAPWLLDSGGFTELSLHGGWPLTPPAFVAQTRRIATEVGGVAHCAPQDWMCEAAVLRRTGLSVPEHQRRTLDNYRALVQAAPELPWLPVLQGWEPDDYLRHADAYARAGIELARAPLVGVGTVCRRQHTREAAALLSRLAGEGLRLHGFGLKVQGLLAAARDLAGADSLAWSFDARRLGHTQGRAWCGSGTHKNCANCAGYALHWRRRVLGAIAAGESAPRQLALWDLPEAAG